MAYDGEVYADEDRKLLARMKRRLKGMAAIRGSYENHWAQVAKLTQPRLGRFINMSNRGGGASGEYGPSAIDYARGDQLNNSLYDPTGLKASDVLGNGLASGLSSDSRKWFKLTTKDPDLREFKPVKEWLTTVEGLLLTLFSETNFYPATKSGYLELGVFGTEATFFGEHWKHVGVVFP